MSLKRGDIVMVSEIDVHTALKTPSLYAVYLHTNEDGKHACVDAEEYDISACGPLSVEAWKVAVPTGKSIYDRIPMDIAVWEHAIPAGESYRKPMDIRVPFGYEELASVLQEAIEQASSGKGKERHAVGDESFGDQLICHLSKQVGVAGPVFQVVKKAVESCRLPYPRSKAELLGAIVYAAAAVMELDRQNAGNA